MQWSKLLSLLMVFGSISLHGCGGGEEEPAEPTEPEEEMVVASSLTFDGLTVEQAQAIEGAIVTGLAETLSAAEDDITITGYTAARRLQKRALASHITGVEVAFTVAVPAGTTAADLSAAVSSAATDSTDLLAAIVAAVEADETMSAALEALGGDLSAVTLTVAEPELVEVDDHDDHDHDHTESPVTEAPVTEAPVTEAPVTDAPTEAPVNGTNSTRRLEFAFTANELIA